MEQAVVERLKREVTYEFAREGPPEGFPKFPDIPAGRYRDTGFFELEMQHLFPRVWLYAGRTEELPEPGSYFCWDRVRLQLVLVRGDDGTVRAFRNRAPEGGPVVVPADESSFVHEKAFDSAGHNLQVQQEFPRYRFSDGMIRCAQSGRVYALDGRLLRGPLDEEPSSLPEACQRLEEVRCEAFTGWMFVNQDPAAPALLEWLSPLPEQMAMFEGDTLRMIDRRWTIIPCNWKVTVEAFQEVYHFKHIHHKGGVSALDQRGATMGILPNGHSRMITPLSKRMAEMSGMDSILDWRTDVARGGFAQVTEIPGVVQQIKGVNGMTRCTSTAFSAFPNLITPVGATGMPFLTAWPIDVRTTLFEWTTFTPDVWGDGPSPVTNPYWQGRLNGFDGIMEEDTRNMAPMQRSLESPGLMGMPVSYQERRIWNCAETVDRIIGREKIRPDLRVPELLGPYVER